MNTRELDMLTQALGATLAHPNGVRNNLTATPGSHDSHLCGQLVDRGYMFRSYAPQHRAAHSEVFKVTTLGAESVRAELMDKVLTDIVSDRVSCAASLMASERVSPNSVEYDSLCEKLADDPKVIAGVSDAMIRDLFGLCAELKTQLLEATTLASDWIPDEFQSEDDRFAYIEALGRNRLALSNAQRVMGNAAWLGSNSDVNSGMGDEDDFGPSEDGSAPGI